MKLNTASKQTDIKYALPKGLNFTISPNLSLASNIVLPKLQREWMLYVPELSQASAEPPVTGYAPFH